MARLAPSSLRVLIVGGDAGTPSYRYRVDHTLEQLRLLGIPCAAIPYGTRLDRLQAAGGERAVLILHRAGLDAWVWAALACARRRRWPVLADIDDFVFDLSVTPWVRGLEVLPPGSDRAYNEGVATYRRCLEEADAVVVPSTFLAREAAKLGRPAFVHRNALSQELIALAEGAKAKREGPLTIGYFSGTYTHNYDFRACSAALAHVLERRPEVRLLIVVPLDLDAHLARLAPRITRLPLVFWQQLPQVMREADINLAPLELENPFCQAKSELKYIEAAVLGIPTVASPTEAFREAITSGKNGWLAATAEEWEEALETLVRDVQLRRQMGEAARKDALERYHPQRRAAELLSILKAIAV